MLQFPPMPDWNSIHPLLIHFPVVLLLLAAVFILIGAVRPPERGRTILCLALGVMAAGTIGTFLAISSGEAAAQLAERSPQVEAVLQHHEHLAEATRTAFSVLTVSFAALLWIPKLLRKASTKMASTILPLAFLVFYGCAALLLANTAHNGARLVHEFGVTAAMKPSPPPKSPAPEARQETSQVTTAVADPD
jgi:uncharacterized membrane protein